MDTTTISYTTTVADDRHSTRLDVAADGSARLAVGSNRDQRARAIGRFEAPLPAALLQRLTQAVSAPALAAAAGQATLVPDESYRRIEVGGGASAALDKTIGEQAATPPAFADAEAVIKEAIAAVARSPVQALAMRLTVSPASLRSGSAATLELQLANVGRGPLVIAAPARWGLQATAATLGGLRSDIATEALGMADQKFVALGAAHFVAAEPAIAGDTLLLPAGGRIKLHFRVPVDWAPGQWRVDVDFEVQALDEAGRPLFSGALFCAPVTWQVLPR